MINHQIQEKKEDQEVQQEKEIIFVDVVKHIYHTQHYIHMLRINMMEYFQLEVMQKEKYLDKRMMNLNVYSKEI